MSLHMQTIFSTAAFMGKIAIRNIIQGRFEISSINLNDKLDIHPGFL